MRETVTERGRIERKIKTKSRGKERIEGKTKAEKTKRDKNRNEKR